MIHVLQLLLVFLLAVAAQFLPPMQYQYMPQPNPSNAIQMPNGLPGPIPNGMPLPNMPSMPHMPGIPPPMLMPPIQMSLNGARLPMVVMPHYSKKKESKRVKRRKHNHKRTEIYSSESDVSSDIESKEHGRKFRSSRKQRREVLTPVVSYVTKDGYVVYQKKIKKEKAKDWLELTHVGSEEFENSPRKWKNSDH